MAEEILFIKPALPHCGCIPLQTNCGFHPYLTRMIDIVTNRKLVTCSNEAQHPENSKHLKYGGVVITLFCPDSYWCWRFS